MDVTTEQKIAEKAQAAPRQQILSATITRMVDAEKLSGKLQALGAEGWRIQQASTIVSNKYIGGPLDEFVRYYAPQVTANAKFWEKIMGLKVAKSGLYFTHRREWATIKWCGKRGSRRRNLS